MKISVIIPTFNRAQTLERALKAFSEQSLNKDDFEVIVVDDGSLDNTEQTVTKAGKDIHHLKYIKQENQGQGIARNTGIDYAVGDIIVFSQDDIIVKSTFLMEHLRFHLRYHYDNDAVLGLTLWHPDLNLTPLMNWLTNGSSILGRFGGHQFAYEKLKGKTTADYNFFYTSNISLKRKLLKKYKFDPSFSGYGWEDIELGYRLTKVAGLSIYYNPDAIGYHYHQISEQQMCSRMQSIGSSAHILHSKYPELKKVPSFVKKLIFVLLSNVLALFLLGVIRDISQGRFGGLYYYALSKKFFLKGIRFSG